MNQKLFDLYNEYKSSFANALSTELKIQGNKVLFNPPIHIDLPPNNDEDFETITEAEFDEKENEWYIHNYITYLDLQADEYWTPLRDLAFDELFKIAERL